MGYTLSAICSSNPTPILARPVRQGFYHGGEQKSLKETVSVTSLPHLRIRIFGEKSPIQVLDHTS
jgi:hypothetical protein